MLKKLKILTIMAMILAGVVSSKGVYAKLNLEAIDTTKSFKILEIDVAANELVLQYDEGMGLGELRGINLVWGKKGEENYDWLDGANPQWAVSIINQHRDDFPVLFRNKKKVKLSEILMYAPDFENNPTQKIYYAISLWQGENFLGWKNGRVDYGRCMKAYKPGVVCKRREVKGEVVYEPYYEGKKLAIPEDEKEKALKEVARMKKELEGVKKELEGVKRDLAKSKEELLKKGAILEKNELELKKGREALEQNKRELSEERAEAKKIKTELTKSRGELGRSKAELAKTKTELNKSKAELTKNKAELTKSKAELTKSLKIAEGAKNEVLAIKAKTQETNKSERKEMGRDSRVGAEKIEVPVTGGVEKKVDLGLIIGVGVGSVGLGGLGWWLWRKKD